MPIIVQCLRCGGRFHAPDESAGQHAKCPKCSETLLIPFGSGANHTPQDEKGVSRNESELDSSGEYLLAEPLTSASSQEHTLPPPSSCPSCGAAIREKSVLCVSCGYNFRTGKHLQTEFLNERPEPAQDRSSQPWSIGACGLARDRSTLMRFAVAIALIAAPFVLSYPMYRLFSALGLVVGDAPGCAMDFGLLYGLFFLTSLAAAFVLVWSAVRNRILTALGLWVVLIFAVGCVSSVLYGALLRSLGLKTAYYSVEVQNRTGEDCVQCEVDFGPGYSGRSRYAGVGGGVANGNSSTAGGFPDPAPTEATVHWKTKSGAEHTQTVSLKSLRGKELDDTTYVFILRYDGTVRAAPFTLAERLAGRDAKLACDNGPTYCVGVKNLTNGRLSDVAVRFGLYQVNAGSYVDAPAKGNSFVFSFGLPYPVTDIATVQWTTADGVAHRDEVPLSPILPEDLEGTCICFLLGDGPPVQVRGVPFEDLRAGNYPELSPKWPRR